MSITVSVNKYGGNCNAIKDMYAQVCASNKVNNMNLKVFNLTWGLTEARFLVQHESCECKCRLSESVSNSKQTWDHNECKFECTELEDWGSCKNDYMWNPSTCDCECNKACKIYEYLDIKNCSCKKCLIGKLVYNMKMKY